ncbi:unnamed protein product [Lactuca saligna]|uniref:Uncharacterized protein n=1 Tax=Lactuca saligna TaxID=75948 RepID=A0AA36EHE4_LACSI|nr:unnamed protein product [Lactuca saligna]
MYVPNNQLIYVVENPIELMLSFYIRYVSWTLTHEGSPIRQHSPSIVASPRRRKKYKSETSSTESATNVSSSQQTEVERTYMYSDTSTRSVKKMKMSTKALVKRLLGIVYIAIWSGLLMERWSANVRWTIYPQELNLQPRKSFL